jgi:DNA-binding transcriptional MerR regulator
MDTFVTDATETGYAIGDVAKICEVPAHTIRFWEREFGEQLSPVRTPGKQRRYSDADIQQIMRIKKLLWTDRFSIHGAKRVLRAPDAITFTRPGDPVQVPDTQELALSIARFIQEQLTGTQTVSHEPPSKKVA